MAKVVVAPYITVKCRDEVTGGVIIREFYQGGVLPKEADPDNVKRLEEGGMVADQGSPEADVMGVPAGTPIPGEPPNVPVTETAQGPALAQDARMANALEAAGHTETSSEIRTDGRPNRNDSKAAWVDYAVSQRGEGVSEEDARAEADGKLKADLIAEYGG
jgi:hypothetical protein